MREISNRITEIDQPALAEAPFNREQKMLRKWAQKKGSRRAPNTTRLKDMEGLSIAEKFELAAYTALEASGLTPKSEKEIGDEFNALGNQSTQDLNEAAAKSLGKKISRIIDEDILRDSLQIRIKTAALMAERFSGAEAFSEREKLLKGTTQYDSRLPIGILNSLPIGPITRRGAGDTLRILYSGIEGVELPKQPNHLRSVD